MDRIHQFPPGRPILPFDVWLDKKYAHISPENEPLFEWDEPEDHFETRAAIAEYVVWTWEQPKELLLDRYTLSQIGSALRNEHHVYADARLPDALRNRAWAALYSLFDHLFAKVCSSALGHLGERQSEATLLDGACYMWWEVSLYSPDAERFTSADHEAFLRFTEWCLRSASPVIQESALHGLGHAVWSFKMKRIIERLIDAFLEENLAARPELVEYALDARRGRVW